MILNCSNGDVWTSELEEKKFGFSNSPIIFKILSDSLYSDKEGSIIRELSSNAIDAHRAAGTPDLPFEISISESSMFYSGSHSLSIKDKGIGLSEEEVYSIYSVYGNSLKRESNDFIGGFGIGSKSPFAYTETFTVSSIHEGMQKVYTAYIGADGYPVIAKMFEKPTDEHNGLEVIIPIKRDDIQLFSQAVVNELSYINPRPVCNGFSPKWMEGKSLYKKNDWEICNKLFRSNDHWFVEIGGFYYPLDFRNLVQGWNNNIHSMKHDVVLHLGIGEIDLSASREQIAYTQKSIAVIMERVKRFALEAYQEFMEYSKSHSKYDTCYFGNHTLPVVCFSEILRHFHKDEYVELTRLKFDVIYSTYDPFQSFKRNIRYCNFYADRSMNYKDFAKFDWNTSISSYMYRVIPAKVIFLKSPVPNQKKIAEYMRTNRIADAILVHGVEYGSTAYYEILEILGNPSEVEVMQIEVKKKEPVQKEDGTYNYKLDTYGQLYVSACFDYCEAQGSRKRDKLNTIFDEEENVVTVFMPISGNRIGVYEDCPSSFEMYKFFKLLNFTMRSVTAKERIQIKYIPKSVWKVAVKAGYDLSYQTMLSKVKGFCERNLSDMLDKELAYVLMEITSDCPRLVYLIEEAREYRISDSRLSVLQKLVNTFKEFNSRERSFITLYTNVYGYDGERTFDWKKYYNDNPILEILGSSGMSDEKIKLCLKKYLTM